MIKRIAITGAALFVAAVLFGNLNTAQAADKQAKASTSEMPAALLALGVENSHVLTQAQAKEVRGEGHRFRRMRFGRFGNIRLNVNVNINTVIQNNVAIGSIGAFQSNSAFIRIRN